MYMHVPYVMHGLMHYIRHVHYTVLPTLHTAYAIIHTGTRSNARSRRAHSGSGRAMRRAPREATTAASRR